jgi:hypothetical protein
VSDPYDHDDESLVLNRADESVVSHAVLPVSTELRPMKRLSESPRIITPRDPVSEKEEQPLPDRTSDLAQLFRRGR